jgi:ankyrin repeat protein
LDADITAAVASGSLPNLVCSLNRRHGCLHSHPVHEAVKRRNVDALKMLLENGYPADEICTATEVPMTPLEVCLSADDGEGFGWMTIDEQVRLAELLLEHGADPNLCIKRTWKESSTPLHIACHLVNSLLVEVLLEHKSDPNAADSMGQTALHTVATLANAHSGARCIMELLVRAGGNPLAECCRGLRPAKYCFDLEALKVLENAERWWRWRMLAWVRARSEDNVLHWLPEELIRQVAHFV